MKKVSLKSIVAKFTSAGLGKIDFWSTASAKKKSLENIGSLCNTLLELRGEASAVAFAEEILNAYRSSTLEEKKSFFNYLLNELAPRAERVNAAITNYQAEPSQLNLQQLSEAAGSPRQDLFRALNMAKNGTAGLIALRADLLNLLKDAPELAPIDNDLLHLFRSWFNRGFLQLRRIDWQTPAVVLEKLIEYESVHEIRGWPDLRRRLAQDRRCFAFFHPAIPDVPLIFVQVALTEGLSASIHDVLDQPQPEADADFRAKAAIFYSINNCLTGLRGVSFGNFLIKQVVENIAAEMPDIELYATLSPIPGFMAWLKRAVRENSLDWLEQPHKELLASYIDKSEPAAKDLPEELFRHLCAWYLLKAKRNDKPVDPVERFHLGNGARLERINWQGDMSANGIRQSAGMLVNYLYDRKTLTRNHEAYNNENEIVCASRVSNLLKYKSSKAKAG